MTHVIRLIRKHELQYVWDGVNLTAFILLKMSVFILLIV